MDEKVMGKSPFLKVRGNVFYFRKRVPERLVALHGATEVVQTLGTSDLREAKRLRVLKEAEWERKFEEYEAKLRVSNAAPQLLLDQLAPLSMQEFVTAWLQEKFEEARRDRFAIAGEGADELASPSQTIKELNDALSDVEHGPEVVRNSWADQTAIEVARRAGIAIETNWEGPLNIKRESIRADRAKKPFLDFREVCRKATCELLRFQISIYAENPRPYAPVYDEFSADSLQEHSNPRPHTLEGLITSFWGDPNNKLSKTLTYKYEFLFSLLKETWGQDARLDEIGRTHTRAARDMILSLPPNCNKKFKGLNFSEIAVVAAKANIPRMNLSTANDHISRMGTFLSFAVREGFIEKNPAENLRIKSKQPERAKRSPFSNEQLHIIFSQNEFSRKGKTRTLKPERYWVPIIALYHGMRLHEICQLLTTDIGVEDGVRYFDVKADAEGQRVKTPKSIRKVPMHPILSKLGFDLYLANLRAKNQTHLFPGIKKEGADFRSRNVGRWFNEKFLHRIGLKEPRLVFHSFRHTFKDSTRNCGVPYEIAEAISGRDLGGVGSQYGTGYSVKQLSKYMRKVAYPGVENLLI